jgi:hypothetical protein
VNVSVSAGAGNRKLIVGLAMESAVSVTALTFDGDSMLGGEIANTVIVTNSAATCGMWEMLEADLPASGTISLALTLSGSATGGGRLFYWLVDDLDQAEAVQGGSGQVTNGAAPGPATFQTDETFDVDSADCFLAAVAYRNDNETSLLLTTPASATNVADVTIAGGGRLSGSHKNGSFSVGTVRPTWTTQTTGQDRRTGAAAIFHPAAADPVEVSGGFTLAAATTAGLLLTTERDVDGAVTLPAVGLGAAIRTILEVSGALQLGAVQVAGALEVPIAISGDVELAPVEVTGSTEEFRAISGNVQLGAVLASGASELITHINASIGLPVVTVGNLGVLNDISGAIELGAVEVSGDVVRIVDISGGFTLGAVQLAGFVARAPEVSGSVELAAVLAAGRLQTQFPGSCFLRDAPAASAELAHADAGFATLRDGPTCSAEIGHA